MKNFSFIIFAFFIFSTVASAANPTDPFFPEYKGLPFLALAPEDRALPPDQIVGIILARAGRVCSFLNQPQGRYRQRRALGTQTTVRPNGQEMVIVELKSGKLKARIIKFPAGENHAEVFVVFRCQGL